MNPEAAIPAQVAHLGIPHPEGERNIALDNGNTWRIGRTGENDIVLLNEWVSRQHALVQRMENGDYYLFDLGSRNGTFLNGARVTVPVVLNNGDRISFGDFHISFHGPEKVEKPPEPALSPEAMATVTYFAQKKTSVLVVDVRGFTRIAQLIDPSQLSQVIGSLFRRGGEIMQKSGSWGQKYIGDALMSVWVHGNAGYERQVLTIFQALAELVEVTDALQSEFQLPFPIGVGAGINTGAASIGNAGSDQHADYTALGDTVNAAFRFESATRDLGLDLVIGQETMACLRKCSQDPERFFEEKTVKLKGYERPSRVWAATFAGLRDFTLNSAAGEAPVHGTAS
jgi:adenylate cyclase